MAPSGNLPILSWTPNNSGVSSIPLLAAFSSTVDSASCICNFQSEDPSSLAAWTFQLEGSIGKETGNRRQEKGGIISCGFNRWIWTAATHPEKSRSVPLLCSAHFFLSHSVSNGKGDCFSRWYLLSPLWFPMVCMVFFSKNGNTILYNHTQRYLAHSSLLCQKNGNLHRLDQCQYLPW